MYCDDLLKKLIEDGKIASVLKEKGKSKEEIKSLQLLLFELGFEKELQWDKYGADGDYGACTTKAVLSFSKKNKIKSDGKKITKELCEFLLHRFSTLDELQQLNIDIKEKNVGSYQLNSKSKIAVAALQTLLNELGFGKELQWQKYQNDGNFGKSTQAALKAFAIKNEKRGDGSKLTITMANLIVKQSSIWYGESWAKERKTISKQKNTATVFKGSNFVGKQVVADKTFIPALNRINKYAKENKVLIHVTSSLRNSTKVAGAIVTPAKMSNHLAGHAIDVNVRYGKDYKSWCNSAGLKKKTLPEPVAGFINAIRKDKGLRWGGDFRTKDPVHIDDHLNKSPTEWKKRFHLVHSS